MAKVQELQHVSLATTYEIDNSFDSDKFLKISLRVAHDGINPNQSNFTLDCIEDAKESIYNIPILANVIFDEEGIPNFSGHDMHIEDDKVNEGQQRLIYDEVPIGLVNENCDYEIKEFQGKNYVYVSAYIWKSYSNYALDVINREQSTPLSMEILVDQFSYNAKQKVYNIDKYRYTGITLLNKNFGTGMENALATTSNFSEDNSSTKLQFIQMMEELKETLVLYNNNSNSNNESQKLNKNNEKGGIHTVAKRTKVFEESAIVEPIVEVVETVESTETEETEEEVVETETIETEQVEEVVEITETIDTVEETVEVETIESTEEFSAKESDESTESETKFIKSFELSHSDIRYGLYQILSQVESSDNEWYFIDKVYDSKFEYMNWDGTKIYRQQYNKTDEVISFEGERVELFQERLTLAEKEALDKSRNEMSANYELLKAEFESLNSYKLEKEREDKAKVFSKFEGLTEEDIKDIKANIDTYSLEILEEKLLLVWAKKRMEFEKTKKEMGNNEDAKDKLIFALTNVGETNVNQSNAPIYADIVGKYNK